MKKSIASKIESLLKNFTTQFGSRQVIDSTHARHFAEKNAKEPDNLHYELNPEKPSITKLPRRLLELLRSWDNSSGFQYNE